MIFFQNIRKKSCKMVWKNWITKFYPYNYDYSSNNQLRLIFEAFQILVIEVFI